MSRGRKLLIVCVVLVVGICLAWPFRRTATVQTVEREVTSRFPETQSVETTGEKIPVQQFGPMGLPSPQVEAKMTGMSEAGHPGGRTAPATSFDLANHPALSALLAQERTSPEVSASPVTPPVPPEVQTELPNYLPAQVQGFEKDARPAYATADRLGVVHSRPERQAEVRHVVQNSDTLEKIAKRYLGDEGRSLEIFDLNRDLLDNPHLLPIGAELRIPDDARNNLD